MMSENYLKYSGIWAGFVLNPYHWEFKIKAENDVIFSLAIYFGPVWIRVVIDGGS